MTRLCFALDWCLRRNRLCAAWMLAELCPLSWLAVGDLPLRCFSPHFFFSPRPLCQNRMPLSLPPQRRSRTASTFVFARRIELTRKVILHGHSNCTGESTP